MKTEKMTLKKWYGSSIRIPSLTDHTFDRFLTNCTGLAHSVIKRNLSIEIRVAFAKIKTAAADFENKKIYLSDNFRRGNFSEINRSSSLSSEETISTILGLLVHESAHFAWSEPLLTAFSNHAKAHSKFPVLDEVVHALGNIIEDIYIEERVREEIPSLAWTLDQAAEVFFPEEFYAASKLNATLITEAPIELPQVAHILNHLIFAKVYPDRTVSNAYIDGLWEEILSVYSMDETLERQALCTSLYDQIVKNLDWEKIKEDQKRAEEQMKEFMKATKALQNALEEAADEAKAKRVMSSIEGDLDKVVEGEIEYSTLNSEYDNKSKSFIERLVAPESEGLKVKDTRYARLSEVGRQRATMNRPYGIDRSRGTHIRKLSRIATDQKIFAETVTMNTYKPMEVIILIDCSGSMASGNNIYKAKDAAYGAALGLLEARCRVAVYGHTADIDESEVTIYCFKRFNESGEILGQRLANDVRLANNRDGDAVGYVGKKFENNRLRQLLIVISDGQPSASSYGGNAAARHTKEEVNKIRQRHIDVLSISITADAQYTNDQIYGKEWNVKNDDVNVIEQVIRKLIES